MKGMKGPYLNQVTSNLAISDVWAAKNSDMLKKAGITHIVTLLSYSNIRPVPEGIKNLEMDILDYPDENIIDELKVTNKFIDDAIQSGGSVLVHCQAGISRSCTVLCAYLMKSKGISRDEAFRMVKEKRAWVKPNDGFWEQLEVYGKCGCDPKKGMPEYDAWEKKFYAWGGPADPAAIQKSKL